MINVVIIDKRHVFMEGLGHIIAQHYQTSMLYKVQDTKELQVLPSDLRPDLVIIGMVRVLQESNLSLVSETASRFPFARIVVVNEDLSVATILRFLRAGARGYLPYDINTSDLVGCLRKVFDNKISVPSQLFAELINYKEERSSRTNTSKLTDREMEVAQMLAQGKKATEIGRDMGVKASTIFATKRMIFRKLGISSMVKLREVCVELAAMRHQVENPRVLSKLPIASSRG